MIRRHVKFVAVFIFFFVTRPVFAQIITPTFTWTKLFQEPTASAGISPNGDRIVFGNPATNQLTVMNWQTQQIKWQSSQYVRGDSRSYWSPDGKYIAALSAGTIYIYDAETGHHISQIESDLNAYSNLLRVLTESEGFNADYTDLKWSMDGKQLAMMLYGYVVIYNLASEKITNVIDLVGIGLPSADLRLYLRWFDWSPDNSKLAAFRYKLTEDKQVTNPLDIVMGVWDQKGLFLLNGEAQDVSNEKSCVPDSQKIFNGFETRPGTDVAWAPDNKTLAVSISTYNGHSYFTACLLRDDGKLVVTKISDTSPVGVHWTSDQKWLFGVVGDCSLLVADVANSYATRMEKFTESRCAGSIASWSRNDRYVVISSDYGAWIVSIALPSHAE